MQFVDIRSFLDVGPIGGAHSARRQRCGRGRGYRRRHLSLHPRPWKEDLVWVFVQQRQHVLKGRRVLGRQRAV
eukprot:6674608-Pyramimonas_sp.AAC.1